MGKHEDRFVLLRKRMEESGALPVPILIVEDDDSRVERFNEWLPPVFRLAHCRTGGAALGLLARSGPWDFAGVMMDFDLDKQVMTDPYVDGEQVLDEVLLRLDRSTNLLVHSANTEAADRMTANARGSNPTVRIDYSYMDAWHFRAWLGDVWSEAVDRHDVFVEHDRKMTTLRYACVVGPNWLDEDPLSFNWSDGKDEE